MSERFDSLKREASIWCDQNIPGEWQVSSGYGEAWEDKFAELIIRECAAFVNTEMSLGGVDGRSLLEHFGVEE